MANVPYAKITRAFDPKKSLTPTQRMSGKFDEEPRIGAKRIKPGGFLLLTKQEMDNCYAQIKVLERAGAIKVTILETITKVEAPATTVIVTEPPRGTTQLLVKLDEAQDSDLIKSDEVAEEVKPEVETSDVDSPEESEPTQDNAPRKRGRKKKESN